MPTVSKKHITRVAIPVIKNAGLLSTVSSHFGKAKGFIVVDSDGENCEYIDTANARLAHECAPVRALANRRARAVVCHSMGRGALAKCHEAGLYIYQACGGKLVVDVLTAWREAKCPDFPDSSICSHHSHDSHHHSIEETS